MAQIPFFTDYYGGWLQLHVQNKSLSHWGGLKTPIPLKEKKKSIINQLTKKFGGQLQWLVMKRKQTRKGRDEKRMSGGDMQDPDKEAVSFP